MKNIYFLYFLILFSCSEKNISNKIIPIGEFTNILQEIYLLESEIKLNTTNHVITYNDNLLLDYHEVFSKYNVSRDDFENTLEYYSEHQYLLQEIYEKILFNLKERRSQLD